MQQVLTATQQAAQPVYVITAADKKRQQKIADAWRAYNGELDKPLIQMQGQPDDNVMSNRCAPFVNAGVDFLFGKELEISVAQHAPVAVQKFIDDVWGRKETRLPLLQKLAMNGAMAGNAFIRIVTSKDGNYRLVVIDPSTVFVQTAPQDCETVTLYCIQFEMDQVTANGKPVRVCYREEMSRIDPDPDDASFGYEDVNADGIDSDVTWSISHWTRESDRGAWNPVGEPIVWDNPFPPLFMCQNTPMPNSPWGTPDITPDLIGLNNSLNLVQSNVSRVEKLYGGPVLYANGMGESDIIVQPGRIISLPTLESNIRAVAIASDTANALSFANNVRSDIDELSATPGVATGRIADIPHGTISGIALQLLFLPLLKKTDKKRCLYGEMIIDVCKALMMLNGMDSSIEVTLNWQSALPDDNLQDLQGAVVKRELGVSSTTLLSELGYNADEEMELNKEEDEQKLINFSQGAGMPPAMPGTPPLPGQAPATPAIPGQPAPAQPQGATA